MVTVANNLCCRFFVPRHDANGFRIGYHDNVFFRRVQKRIGFFRVTPGDRHGKNCLGDGKAFGFKPAQKLLRWQNLAPRHPGHIWDNTFDFFNFAVRKPLFEIGTHV